MVTAASDAISSSRIDRLGDELRGGKCDEGQLVMLTRFRSEFQPAYERVTNAARVLRMNVTGRPSKSTASIVEKLRREKCRLSQMQDVAGIRIVVEDIPAQESALFALQVFLPNVVVVDRRVRPSHGYRAVHLIYRHDGRAVEIQLRTALQHYWGELSEKLSDTVDNRLKYGGGDERLLRMLTSVSTAIARLESVEADRDRTLKELQAYKGLVPKPAKKALNTAEREFQSRRRSLIGLLDALKAKLS